MEQLDTKYTHSKLRFTTKKDLQLKNEVIELLKSGEMDDPVGCPQRTVRTRAPSNKPDQDAHSADTYIPKEVEATPVLSSLDKVEAEITSALVLDPKIIPRYNRLDATIKIGICTLKVASSKFKLIILLTMEHWGYRDTCKKSRPAKDVTGCVAKVCI